MKRLILIATAAALLASCQAQQSDQPSQPDPKQTPATEALTVQVEIQPPIARPGLQPLPPVDGVLRNPLPEGVALSQPHYARMDVPVPNKNGASGRRTEFEYLEGDAGQAMQAFATSMMTAGFVSDDGPSSKEGVVRQVFKKPGYGTAFVRAQQQPPSRNIHDAAFGFVVVAWPG